MDGPFKRDRDAHVEDTSVNTEDAPKRRCFRIRSHYFVSGDIVWVRPPRLPYWPAEVTLADDGANTITARLFDPPASQNGVLTDVTATKVYFFDRLNTPEELADCIEARLRRDAHNVTAYEADFHRAVLHANRLVRSVFSAELLRPFAVCGVGVVHSLMRTHISAPRQPHTERFEPQTAVIRLRTGLENALRDLKGFEYIWVLFHFSYAVPSAEEPSRRHGSERSAGFKTMIVPPRDSELRGVFATRSPHRPNFIGLSCVRLVEVRGLEVHIADHDLLHGTPVLDIKPYLPFCDAHPDAKAGWVEALDQSGGGGADHKYAAQSQHVDRIFEDAATAEKLRGNGEKGGKV